MTKRLSTVRLRRDLSYTALDKAMKAIDRGYRESWQLSDIAEAVWKSIMRDRLMLAAAPKVPE